MKKCRYMFLICPDAQLLREQLNTFFSGKKDGFERKVFWGDEDLPDTFWQDLTIKGLFSTPKALIIRRAHNLKAQMWDKLDGAMGNIPSDVQPFFCLEGDWDKRKNKAPVPAIISRRTIWKTAEKNGWIWQSAGLTTGNMTAYVQQWANRCGISMQGNVQGLLCNRLPEDAHAAALELDKMELAAGDEKILKPEHLELISASGEMDFFEFMDALSKGQNPLQIWQKVLGSHQEKDSMVFLLLSSLSREARTLWMLAHGEDGKAKMHPYVKKLKTPLAHKLGAKGIARLIDMTLDTELSIKSGTKRPEQALDILIANLTTLFGSGRMQRR